MTEFGEGFITGAFAASSVALWLAALLWVLKTVKGERND